MFKRNTRFVVVALLPLALGACQSFLGIRFAGAKPKAVPAAPAQNRHAMTEEGRRLLDEGNTGAALDAFQRALAMGEPASPAFNGLGVTYARLGRFDLAQRYFESAAAQDAGNPRYRDNLARLMRSPVFAMRHDGDLLAQALTVGPKAEPLREAAPAARGKLQRVSRAEVRIETVAPAGALPRRAALTAGFKPLIRVEFAEKPKDRTFQPLVRIELPKALPAVGAPATLRVASGAAIGRP